MRYERGEGRYEGGWVSELKVREKGMRGKGGGRKFKFEKMTVSFFTLKNNLFS